MRRLTSLWLSSNFNPRTHVGCDLPLVTQHPRSRISIHAPTWGATSFIICSFVLLLFQSTHPRGVRLRFLLVQINLRYFNPRTHVGCDKPTDALSPAGTISIHAPTWGATIDSLWNWLTGSISIHAPTWGATPPGLPRRGRGDISIHAPTWGATLCANIIHTR